MWLPFYLMLRMQRKKAQGKKVLNIRDFPADSLSHIPSLFSKEMGLGGEFQHRANTQVRPYSFPLCLCACFLTLCLSL